MCRLQNIAMRDYQESVTTGQTDGQTDAQTDRQTPDKVIPMCHYASQATQKLQILNLHITKAIMLDCLANSIRCQETSYDYLLPQQHIGK